MQSISVTDVSVCMAITCLLFLVLLDIHVRVTRLSHHLMSLSKNLPTQSSLDFTF